jgi:hypothetical protein
MRWAVRTFVLFTLAIAAGSYRGYTMVMALLPGANVLDFRDTGSSVTDRHLCDNVHMQSSARLPGVSPAAAAPGSAKP